MNDGRDYKTKRRWRRKRWRFISFNVRPPPPSSLLRVSLLFILCICTYNLLSHHKPTAAAASSVRYYNIYLEITLVTSWEKPQSSLSLWYLRGNRRRRRTPINLISLSIIGANTIIILSTIIIVLNCPASTIPSQVVSIIYQFCCSCYTHQCAIPEGRSCYVCVLNGYSHKRKAFPLWRAVHSSSSITHGAAAEDERASPQDTSLCPSVLVVAFAVICLFSAEHHSRDTHWRWWFSNSRRVSPSIDCRCNLIRNNNHTRSTRIALI